MANPYKPKLKTPAKAFLGVGNAFIAYAGVSFLERLKQAVDAAQIDMITVADIEMFLKHFYQNDPSAMLSFKENMDKLTSAISAKIIEEMARSKDETSSTPNKNTEVIYTTKDVCSLLNVTKQTIVHWINKGWLVAKQNVDAGKYHIAETELIKFINSGNGKKYSRIWNIKRAKP